jgi:hypothetical protein
VRTGATLRFRVEGEVSRAGLEVGVWVRTVPDGTALFAAYSAPCGVTLPRNGAFDVGVELDVNLGSGAFALQPFLFESESRRLLRKGCLALFEVHRELRAFGHVDLNARMRSVDP